MTDKSMTKIEKLDALHRAAAEANSNRKAVGQELRAARELVQALHDERARLVYRDPTLVDHRGCPADGKDSVGEIDREIAKAPDLVDLEARYDHLRLILDRAQEAARNFTAENAIELFDEHRPDGEKIAGEVKAAAEAFLDVLDRYRRVRERSLDIAHDVPDLEDRQIPGQDVLDLARAIERFHFAPPVPDLKPQLAHVIDDPADVDHRGSADA